MIYNCPTVCLERQRRSPPHHHHDWTSAALTGLATEVNLFFVRLLPSVVDCMISWSVWDFVHSLILMVCSEKLITNLLVDFKLSELLPLIIFVIESVNLIQSSLLLKQQFFFCLTQIWGPCFLVTPQQRQSQLHQHQRLVQVFPLIPDLLSPSSKWQIWSTVLP